MFAGSARATARVSLLGSKISDKSDDMQINQSGVNT